MPEPRLYSDLACWWPVLSPPGEYAEEARLFRRLIVATARRTVDDVLELGSGGGNTASHLRAWFRMTLVDVAPAMLEVSRALNPDVEHVQGDMRTVRLGRTFDAVLIHDAIAYMTTEADLAAALATARLHCRPGGVALFVPDDVRETYAPYTKHGGSDQGARSLRYLEWSLDPDPDGTTCPSVMVYVMREGDGPLQVVVDEHVSGLFPRETWRRQIAAAGFVPVARPFTHSRLPRGTCELFLGRVPGDAGP